MTPGYDFSKRNVLRRWRNIDKDCADVISSGNRFQIRGSATLKAIDIEVNGCESLIKVIESSGKSIWRDE